MLVQHDLNGYKPLFPNLLILNITTSEDHARNVMAFMDAELDLNSKSMLFKGFPVLGSFDTSPTPLTGILDLPFERAGHPAFIIANEVERR